MPLYEYQCKQCNHRFEKIQSFSAPEEKVCPECGGEVERLISAPAIQFKGSGWYVSDYARGGSGSKPSGEPKGESSGESSNGSGSAENKTGADAGATAKSKDSGSSSSPAAPSTSSSKD